MKARSEIALARYIIRHLERNGWQCGSEVRTPDGSVIDIVARKLCGPALATYAVECKTGLSLRLLQQTYHASQYANQAAAAIWQTQRESDEGEFAVLVCRRFGLGLLAVDDAGTVTEVVHARTVDADCAGGLVLRPRHADFAEAGNNQGKRLSAYQETRERVVKEFDEFVQANASPHRLTYVLRNCRAERWRNEVLRDLRDGKFAGVTAIRISGLWFVRKA